MCHLATRGYICTQGFSFCAAAKVVHEPVAAIPAQREMWSRMEIQYCSVEQEDVGNRITAQGPSTRVANSAYLELFRAPAFAIFAWST